MPKKPLCVAFLWHMHQPDYHDTQTREIFLPWTRFHAVKDYYDMGALVEEAGIHLTINVVPSLIDQLVDYGSGKARSTYAALTLRNADDLNEREKAFLLRTFFQLPPKQMVLTQPRYRDLMDRRGSPDDNGGFPVGLKRYTARDYRDLQLWYNLSWCGQELRKDPEIEGLFRKGKGFTEEDKKRLLDIQYSFISRILPFYRKLMESHNVEISISPYYHPILPLLCDMRSARQSLPSITLPAEPFAYPEDAKEQINWALQKYREHFGRDPRGMWPSEGSISDAALELARSAGLRWLASDEDVLFNSLQKADLVNGCMTPEQKYSVYRWGKGSSGPCLFFRDHALSDLIGFTYCQWSAKDAVSDFIERLRGIHKALPDDGLHYVVPVILDGENAWEHYPQNGSEFLSLLYRTIIKTENLCAVTFSEFLDLESGREPLESVVSGSWIYGNLATWVGHPEKNRAWEELGAARRFLYSSRVKGIEPEKMNAAHRELMIAEGSDWFWWYGDDHYSENAAEFDILYRGHLKNIYKILGESAPAGLEEPIKKAGVRTQYRNPIHTMTPRLDGKITDYFEWLSAGWATPGGGESMHRAERCVEKVMFGFDLQYFYLRIDLSAKKIAAFASNESVQVQFVYPNTCILALECEEKNNWNCRVLHWPVEKFEPQFAGNRVLELGIPLVALGVHEAMEVKFSIVILDGKRETERFPSSGFLTVYADPWNLDQREWIV